MSKYLHNYDTSTEFKSVYDGSLYNEPWVSLTEGTQVDYNKYDMFNGYSYIDMGLPSGTLWATEDLIDPSNSAWTKNKFAWGEISSKSNYTWSTYFDTSDGGTTFNKYDISKKTSLDIEDDAAHIIWEGEWRIPTLTQWQELLDNCTTFLDVYENFVTFTSNINNNEIVFRPSGYYDGTSAKSNNGRIGYYWTLNFGGNTTARCISFSNGNMSSTSRSKYYGQSIRPVVSPVS